MRRVGIVGVLAVVVFGIMAASADLPSSCISWSADRPLTWADFWAPRPSWAGPSDVAQIFMSLGWTASISAHAVGTSATAQVTALTVTNVMDPARSWRIENPTAGQLRHEQFHFNLHEVYRRLAQTALSCLTVSYQAPSPSATAEETAVACRLTLNRLLTDTGSAILARANAACVAYDSETDHGRNAEGQARWEALITSLLLNPAAAP